MKKLLNTLYVTSEEQLFGFRWREMLWFLKIKRN